MQLYVQKHIGWARFGLQDVVCQPPIYTVARFNLNWIHLTLDMSFLVAKWKLYLITHPAWCAYMRTRISELCPHNTGCKKKVLGSLISLGEVGKISVQSFWLMLLVVDWKNTASILYKCWSQIRCGGRGYFWSDQLKYFPSKTKKTKLYSSRAK